MMDILDGATSALAIPCMARNIISSIPVQESPLPSMKAKFRKQPARLTGRGPITSAKDLDVDTTLVHERASMIIA